MPRGLQGVTWLSLCRPRWRMCHSETWPALRCGLFLWASGASSPLSASPGRSVLSWTHGWGSQPLGLERFCQIAWSCPGCLEWAPFGHLALWDRGQKGSSSQLRTWPGSRRSTSPRSPRWAWGAVMAPEVSGQAGGFPSWLAWGSSRHHPAGSWW